MKFVIKFTPGRLNNPEVHIHSDMFFHVSNRYANHHSVESLMIKFFNLEARFGIRSEEEEFNPYEN